VPPPLANLRRLIPPTLTGPVSSLQDTVVIILVFIYENWSTEIEYDEKGIVVEDVDEWMMGSIAYGLHCLRSRKT
jgi:hypothetical protein